MKLLALILFMTSTGNTFNEDGRNTLIYEFAMKRPGVVDLGFIVIDKNFYQNIAFNIRFSKGRLINVNKNIGTFQGKYRNPIGRNAGRVAYTSDEFALRRRLIPDNVYQMISPDFLSISNQDRLRILESLSARLQSLGGSCTEQAER